MTLRTLAGSSPFAHLLGRQRAAAGNSKADEREEDEDEKKASRAEEGDEKDERADESEDEKKDDAKAEGSDEDEADEEGDDARKANGKKAKAEGDDESDEKDEDDAKASAARRRERARCAAIFGVAAAGTRPDMAAYFAFGTNMPRSAAVNALKAVVAGQPEPAKARGGLSSRMANTPSPNVGAEPAQPSGSASLAQQIVAAGKKARGEA
jgi:hypothetical protein